MGEMISIDQAEFDVSREQKMFELAQRKAQVYAKSTLVPKEYRNNVGNVMIATNMAQRLGADVMMVMQNLYIVLGKPGWSAQFLIACLNACGRFSAIKYRFDGVGDDYGCTAYCKELSTGETIEGAKITWEMVKAEGWLNKDGSKWKSMPDQMFRYRSATFLCRATAPEIGMGLLTKEELDELPPSRSFDVDTRSCQSVLPDEDTVKIANVTHTKQVEKQDIADVDKPDDIGSLDDLFENEVPE